MVVKRIYLVAKVQILGRMNIFLYICHYILRLMKTISRTFFSMPVNCIVFLVVPVFIFLFILGYNPFGMDEFLAGPYGRYTLNLLVTTLIVLGVVSLSRMLLFILRHRIEMNWALYILWCVMEVVVSGLFMSILLGIAWHGIYTYFYVMGMCVLMLLGITAFPYAIITLSVQVYVLGKKAALAPQTDERTLIRFNDSYKRLKLIVSSESVLYVKAEDNYVHIVYLDGARLRDFLMRSSMSALEEILTRHGLVRCHRSYFVNPVHVDLVKKDEGGFAVARLDAGDASVPVSKRYYDALAKML